MFYFQSVFTFVVPVLISLLLYAVKQIKKKKFPVCFQDLSL